MNPDDAPVNPDPMKDRGDDIELKQIRTFQGDVAEAIRSQQESLYSIQTAEKARQEKKREEVVSNAPVNSPVEATPLDPEAARKRKSVLLLGGTILLVILGVVGGYFGFREFRTNTTPPTFDIPANRFIRSALEVELYGSELSRETLMSKMFELESTEVPESGILHIVIRESKATSTLLSTEKFLSLIEARPPASLVRAFSPLFMFGFIGIEGENFVRPSNFILIRLTSFENAFPGMLEWEKTLVDDLLPLFTTRALVRNLAQNASFEDITIRNKDARVLRGEDGKALLLYSFFDNNMLVVTDNEETFRTLVIRLTNEKLER